MSNVKVPDGDYFAVPAVQETENGQTYAQLGLSKKSSTKQVLIMFRITNGPYKGIVLPWFGYFTADSAERTIASLRLCGFKGEDIFAIEGQKLTGSVKVTVETGNYNGKKQTRVAWVNDPNYVPSIKVTRMSAEEMDEFRKSYTTGIFESAAGNESGDDDGPEEDVIS